MPNKDQFEIITPKEFHKITREIGIIAGIGKMLDRKKIIAKVSTSMMVSKDILRDHQLAVPKYLSLRVVSKGDA